MKITLCHCERSKAISYRSILFLLTLVASMLISCEKIPETPEPTIASIEPRTIGDEITIVFGGDTMLDDLALPYIMKYGYSYPIEELSGIFKKADIAVINLEAPVVNECKRAVKKQSIYSYFVLPEALIAMKDAGINVLDFANNHTFDCEVKGASETLANIERVGLYHFGAGKNEQSRKGLVINVKNTRVGLLGYWQFTKPHEGGWQTGKTDKAILAQDVKRMKKHYCDLLFVVFHWGKNYHFDVYKAQKQLAEISIDAGADAVVGHHAHMEQPTGTYKGKPIIYSVGNMAFGTGNTRAEYGFLAKFTVNKSKITRTELIPIWVQNRNPQVLWQTRILNNNRGKALIERVSNTSEKHNATLTWENGVGVLLQTR